MGVFPSMFAVTMLKIGIAVFVIDKVVRWAGYRVRRALKSEDDDLY